MMIAVVSVPTEYARAFAPLLPATDCRAEGGGRSYFLYSVGGAGFGARDEAFTDPIDGQLLTEVRYFLTEVEAKTWVEQQVAASAAIGRVH